jgi:protein involved in polysaccharide export with SLBB domain
MKKFFLLISILTLSLSTPVFSASTSDIVAQKISGTGTNSGDQGSGDSNANIFSTDQTGLNAGSGKLGISNAVDTTQMMQLLQSQGNQDQLNTLKNASDAKKAEVFKSLNEDEKVKNFKELSNEDQMKYFRDLTDERQILFFKGLDNSQKISLFKRLSQTERSKIFDGLNKYEQSGLLDSLSNADERSEIEEILSGQFPNEITKKLDQYGYSFFAKDTANVAAFEPLKNIPVGSDYIIGPGDSFTIYLWGGAEQTHDVTVSRDGNIIIPHVGTLNVSGLTFAELKIFLNKKLKEFFKDFQINVTMDALRTIEIFLVGEVKNPGTYSVSSLSTIVTALYVTGGPTKKGSLRNISLIRNGKTVTTLDLYDFFIKGVKDNDLRLEPGDTIFIPVIEPVVGISGYVKRPAIYEMKGNQTIGDIIDLAGGVLPVSYLENVVVERITDHQKRIVKTFDLDPSGKQTNDNLKTPVQDGDLIQIYPVYEAMRQVVYLTGHVKYPREYEFKEGMRLLDLIPSYNYLKDEPYLPVAEIIRLMPPDLHQEIVQFNLDKLLSGDASQNLVLEDQDRIIVYGKWEKKDRPTVTIKGEVRNPGVYPLVEGMTVKDLIFLAGNLTDKAFLDNADLTRFVGGKDNTESVISKFSVEKALEADSKDNIQLAADDMVHIRAIPAYSQALSRKIYLEGEFIFPGEYSFSDGERLSSVISRAGGLTQDAYPFGAIFQREAVKESLKLSYKDYEGQLEKDVSSLSALAASGSLEKEDLATVQATMAEKKELLNKLKSSSPTGRMLINLNKLFSSPSSDYDFKLRSGDRLIVSKKQDFVNITGEVYNSTAVLFQNGRSVDYYLSKVGGPTKSAAKGQIYVVKANGTVISKQQGGIFGLGLWDEGNSRWSFGGFGSIELDPGDTIIVPQRTASINWLKGISDITQILYQIAVAAQVVHGW